MLPGSKDECGCSSVRMTEGTRMEDGVAWKQRDNRIDLSTNAEKVPMKLLTGQSEMMKLSERSVAENVLRGREN